MATAVDPVRRTLDTLALDPSVATDRPYLESMLRRLGYSEAEIQAALHGTPGTAGGAAQTDDDRIIELEYTGQGLKEFVMVVGVDESELATDQYGLGTGMEAGTEVFEGGPSMEEVDRLVAEGDLADFDDWGEGKPREDVVGEVEKEKIMTEDGKLVDQQGRPITEEGAIPAPDDGEEGAPADKLQEGLDTKGIPVGGKEPEKPGPGGPDFQSGEALVEFKETAINEAVIEPLNEALEADRLRDEGWEVADPQSGEFPPEPVAEETWEHQEDAAAGEPALASAQAMPPGVGPGDETWEAPEEPFQYGDWTLHKRDELKGDTPQRVYFFSKGTPALGQPASMPPGYEVAENPDTGRPYLRKAGTGGSAGSGSSMRGTDIESAHPSAQVQRETKKRVRILRVRASSREEAIAKLRAEGRNVIASMPIDIEKKLR